MQRITQITHEAPNSPITSTCLQSHCVFSSFLKEYVGIGMEVAREARKETEHLSLKMKLFSSVTRDYLQHLSEAGVF